MTYVCGRVLLVGAEDGTAALSGVESTLALDGGLTVGARSTDGLADLGDLVPVAHCEGVVKVLLLGLEVVGCKVIAWEVVLVWCVWYVCDRKGHGGVKNMMCSGLWGGGGVGQ